MARLPTVNGDDGNWGSILNDFLSQVHADDGTLKAQVIGAPQLKQNAVTSAAIAPGAVIGSSLGVGAVTASAVADGALPSAKLSDLGKAGGVATLDGNGSLITASGDIALTGRTLDAASAAVIQNNASAVAGALNATYAPAAGSANYISKSAVGYAGSPSFVQDATISPSPVDARQLNTPVRSSAPVVDAALVVGQRRNIWQYTEEFSSNRYTAQSATKQTDTIVTGDGMVLTRASMGNFYSSIRSQLSGLGVPIFTVGRRYLLSYYVLSQSSAERFFWMRNISGSRGHGQRLLESNKLTRAWSIVQAVSTTQASGVDDPTVGFSTVPNDPYWLVSGNQSTDGDNYDVYLGGFQIEEAGATAVDGIAVIGDSTIQGSSGGTDSPAARETMGYLAGLLNVNTYNRGIGGNTTLQMDTRWATDITPMKSMCKYALIQGGINDIGQGRALVDIQGNISSMVAKAKADGLIPVLLTCTPTASIAADPAKETMRLSLNAWIKQTFANVIDIAPVVADPFDPKYLRRDPAGVNGWYGDGVHYSRPAKRAVAEKIAAWQGWSFPTPSPYQKVVGGTFATTGAVVLVSPDGTKYKLSVANGGALTATAA